MRTRKKSAWFDQKVRGDGNVAQTQLEERRKREICTFVDVGGVGLFSCLVALLLVAGGRRCLLASLLLLSGRFSANRSLSAGGGLLFSGLGRHIC